MKFGEAKDLIWKILDEHSSGGAVEHDPDLALRMAAALNSQLISLATVRRIRRTYEPTYHQSEEAVIVPMPGDFFEPLRLWADGSPIARGTWQGNSLVLQPGESRSITVEYYAYPPTVSDQTPDGTELELDEDAAACACYWTAAALSLADPVVDSGRIGQLAKAMEDRLRTDERKLEAVIQTELAPMGGIF